ncbi:flagellar basal body rod protein FlgB, partial [Steroidobacter sp.]|uniref:flagellar basal body rod protein FlgB n=1 Tax=Steroidobacter sp. TaxID=1978227 RepID=UPI001A58FFA2
MGFNLDAEPGLSAQALNLHARRLELAAQNIANADTPNFKARDIDFRAALAAFERAAPPEVTATCPA